MIDNQNYNYLKAIKEIYRRTGHLHPLILVASIVYYIIFIYLKLYYEQNINKNVQSYTSEILNMETLKIETLIRSLHQIIHDNKNT